MDVKIGENVFLYDGKREFDGIELIEVPVVKIGSKYITIKQYSREIQFYRDSLIEKSEYTTYRRIYKTKDDFLRCKIRYEKEKLVYNNFSRLNYSKFSDAELDILINMIERYKNGM